jgi:hypothetical protein
MWIFPHDHAGLTSGLTESRELPMDDVLAATAIGVVVVGGVLVRARFWPYGPCPACKGRRGRGRGSTDKAWSRCPRCGGGGERVRPISRIYGKWRDEDRARKRR